MGPIRKQNEVKGSEKNAAIFSLTHAKQKRNKFRFAPFCFEAKKN
jgi:hypothetical protein